MPPLRHPTRRNLLKFAALSPALMVPGLSGRARAQVGPPANGNPGYFHATVGQARITVLSDGFFSVPVSLGENADPADVKAFFTRNRQSPEQGFSHTNLIHIELGDARVLVDVGSGDRWFPTTGRLLQNMAAAGIDADAITHVAITHGHPDHIWGTRDDFDEMTFPNARHVIGADEYAYWMQDDLVNQVPEDRQQFVIGAVNSLTVEGLEWDMMTNGAEVAPGIRMIAAPGHTAGHMAVVVESEGRQLMAVGDALTHALVNFAHPGWHNGVDALPDAAAATRTRLLDMAAADEISVLGYHFPFPGVGQVVRDGAAFRFLPDLWQF